MRYPITVVWIFAILSRIVGAVTGGTQLTHNFEAIYFYYGYLVDVAINGEDRTLGPECTPSSGSVCSFWEFIHSIEEEVQATYLRPNEALGSTTRPDDLKELANAMTEWNYKTYTSTRLVNDGTRAHSTLLNKVTTLLNDARENHPAVLTGNILEQAKKTIAYIHGLRAEDLLPFKKVAFKEAWGEDMDFVDKTVSLDEDLFYFQDIDWDATAEENMKGTKFTKQDMLDGYSDFAKNMRENVDVEASTRIHLGILQSVRTQYDSLTSGAKCVPIG
ncbi:hypothetical protein N7451_004678 [Penicillium sp. IBT 35674x]|nr:hypothetical protein N7451_004678 [Penicillium sp. IBT 35674x]